jgi:predicted DNA-binding transcriptional regulator YafY
MAGITLAQAQQKLDAYLAAEEKILHGQAVTLDGNTMTRANLDTVQKGITLWNDRVIELTTSGQGRGRMRTISPIG